MVTPESLYVFENGVATEKQREWIERAKARIATPVVRSEPSWRHGLFACLFLGCICERCRSVVGLHLGYRHIAVCGLRSGSGRWSDDPKWNIRKTLVEEDKAVGIEVEEKSYEEVLSSLRRTYECE